jgi:hypothetical protein
MGFFNNGDTGNQWITKQEKIHFLIKCLSYFRNDHQSCVYMIFKFWL